MTTAVFVVIGLAVVLDGYGRTAALTGALGNSGCSSKPVLDGRRDILVDGAGVCLLLLNAEIRQQVQNYVRFDFQLPRQLIDSDLQLHRMMYCVRTV